MKTTLQRWGNSQGIRIPEAVAEALGLEPGSEVELSLADDRSSLTIRPLASGRPIRGRCRLEDLVSGHKNTPAEPFGTAEGRETW